MMSYLEASAQLSSIINDNCRRAGRELDTAGFNNQMVLSGTPIVRKTRARRSPVEKPSKNRLDANQWNKMKFEGLQLVYRKHKSHLQCSSLPLNIHGRWNYVSMYVYHVFSFHRIYLIPNRP